MKAYIALLVVAILCVASPQAQVGIWSGYVNISSNSGQSKFPELIVDHVNCLHVVWQDHTAWGGQQGDIRYSRFDGQSWSPHERVSFPYPNYSATPRMAVDSQNQPHVVWSGNYWANPIAYYSVRDSIGIWSEPLTLSVGASYNCGTEIAIDSRDYVHVIWGGHLAGPCHLLYRCFDGSQWSPIEDLTPDHEGMDPRLVVDSQDRLHLVYRGETSALYLEIMYAFKDSSGWSGPVILSATPTQSSAEPDIAVDEDDNPHVVWEQRFGGGSDDVYYRHFDGLLWSSPMNLSNSMASIALPSIAISSGMVFVAYSQIPDSGYALIKYTFCCDSVWSEPDTLHLIPENHIAWTAPAFDASGHLQLICTPYLSYLNTELFHQTYINSPALLPTDLAPHNPPIIIPRSGGNFRFDLQVGNQAVLPVTFDVWINMLLPNGSASAPILLRRGLNLASNSMIARSNLMQSIPRSALPGQYYYCLRAGDYSDSIIVSSDSFAFVKEGVSVSAEGRWLLEGWDENNSHEGGPEPISFSLLPPKPNPFNPSTVLSYQL
ncbi:MAG TPA: hypothetical protein VF398_12400, partial [bacterium]